MTDKQMIVDGVDVSECEHHVCLNTSLFKEKTLVQCSAFFLENEDSCCECSDNPNCYYKQLKRREQRIVELNKTIKAKEQECEKLKEELQAQRDFTAHEQKLIYCVAYDETCKTGNDCKQKKCIFKDNIKLKKLLQRQKRLQKI